MTGAPRPLRLLVLAPHAFYIDRGTPIDVDILVRALSGLGHACDLVVYADGEGRDYPGLTVHRARTPAGIGPGFSLKKLIADWSLLWVTLRLVRANTYDTVHAGEEAVFIAMLVRLLSGVPYVYDMDSSIAQQMVEKMPWLRPVAGLFDWFEARAIKGAIACAPVCNALGELARRRGARDVEVLHDISQLDPDAPVAPAGVRERLGLAGPVFMYVGNLEAYQGVGLLLEGFAEARRAGTEADLVVAGGSPGHIGRYQTMAERLGVGDRAHFLGPWPAAELGSLLAEADVLVAPRTKGINTPMKIFPYLHSGKAVLLTKLPTHTQVLDGTQACLADPTPGAFGRAIAELAGDAGLRERLGASGRAFVERDHTYRAHAERVAGLYERVTAALDARRSKEERR